MGSIDVIWRLDKEDKDKVLFSKVCPQRKGHDPLYRSVVVLPSHTSDHAISVPLLSSQFEREAKRCCYQVIETGPLLFAWFLEMQTNQKSVDNEEE